VTRRRPVAKSTGKKVWRITEAAPMGEFVDPDSAPAPLNPAGAEAAHGGWLESSLDLMKGTEVIDDPDSMPADLFDEWWGPKPPRAEG